LIETWPTKEAEGAGVLVWEMWWDRLGDWKGFEGGSACVSADVSVCSWYVEGTVMTIDRQVVHGTKPEAADNIPLVT